MINYDTIISNFDDKVTLYNWLRKVEEALKNASATNFVVNKKGNATLSFSITFADGETLESGDIVLQQGESVDQARIASGILQLHLTNGTWLTAGNIKPVSNFNIDTNQHLIVNYQDNTSQDLGPIFNGNVNIAGNFTANSIIENMTGYSFTNQNTDTNTTINNVFCSPCKNGNKITFVWYFEMSHNANGRDYIYPGYFDIPTAVADKLLPITLGSIENCLAISSVYAYKSEISKVQLDYQIMKFNNHLISLVLHGCKALEANTTYIVRVEHTFLLNNSLAQ